MAIRYVATIEIRHGTITTQKKLWLTEEILTSLGIDPLEAQNFEAEVLFSREKEQPWASAFLPKTEKEIPVPGIPLPELALPEQVNLREAAEWTGESKKTIREWIASGRLRAQKVGPTHRRVGWRWRILLRDLAKAAGHPLVSRHANLREAATLAQVSEGTIRGWISSGRLKAERKGLTWQILGKIWKRSPAPRPERSE